MPDDEVDGFSITKEERERDRSRKGKVRLPKFALPQPFDGTMKETSPSLVFSHFIYIWEEAEFPSNELKIMFVLSILSGGESALLEK